MLENFIYAKQKSLFEEALNNGEVLDEAIVFIEDTKEIWNHGTYFDGSIVDLSNIETFIQNILDNKADKTEIPTKVSELENDVSYLTEHQDISHLATKNDVSTAISELVDSAPETLNTLNELATAITEHQDVTDVLDAAISNKLDKTEAETIYQPIGDYATKDDIKTSGALTLRAYIFNVSGTYTKTELEALLGVELNVLINSMKKGNPITIFSSDDVSCNISFVVESNCTITTEGELESLTLFWHQYQLWNTVSISLDSSGNYVMSNTTSS